MLRLFLSKIIPLTHMHSYAVLQRPNAHTHARTHARMHTHPGKYTRTHARMHAHPGTHTNLCVPGVRASRHARAHANADAYTFAHECTNARTLACTRACVHTLARTLARTHAHVLAQSLVGTRIPGESCIFPPLTVWQRWGHVLSQLTQCVYTCGSRQLHILAEHC